MLMCKDPTVRRIFGERREKVVHMMTRVKVVAGAILALFLAAGAQAESGRTALGTERFACDGVYSGVSCDGTGLSGDAAEVGGLVSVRVAERLDAPRAGLPALKVVFSLDPALGGDTACVSVSNGCARIRGAWKTNAPAELATIDPKIMSLEGFSAKRNDAQLNI